LLRGLLLVKENWLKNKYLAEITEYATICIVGTGELSSEKPCLYTFPTFPPLFQIYSIIPTKELDLQIIA